MLAIITQNDIFADNPWMRADHVFGQYSSEQLKYVGFYADAGSPYRELPKVMRKNESLLSAHGAQESTPEMILSVSKVKPAIDHWMKLQSSDSVRDSLDGVITTIADINKTLAAPKSKKDLLDGSMDYKRLIQELPGLHEMKRKLMVELNLLDKLAVIPGGEIVASKPKSLIDELDG